MIESTSFETSNNSGTTNSTVVVTSTTSPTTLDTTESSTTTGTPPNKLQTFLLGTIQSQCPLQLLRGHTDILRMIWVYACSEWWSLHIQQYSMPTPGLSYDYGDGLMTKKPTSKFADLHEMNMTNRNATITDCPIAIVEHHVDFPPLGHMPSAESTIPIAVNMMPFDIFQPAETLPSYLHGYVDMIKKCRKYVKSFVDFERGCLTDPDDIRHRIAYLTVDERPIRGVGSSHRRGGLHVESPGALRNIEVVDKSHYTPELNYYHPWGFGTSSGEFLVGGIFLASNMSDTTAVWNCRVHDTFGDVISKHGSLERCRDILGAPSKILNAGELVWITDRTPHESLPIQNISERRQFFRLVVGEISFWFADHNTPNPTGFAVPDSVPIVEGNKYTFTKEVPVVWECGSQEEMTLAKENASFRATFYKYGFGYLVDEFSRKYSVYNKKQFAAKAQYKLLSCYVFHRGLKNPPNSATMQYVRIRLEQMRIELLEGAQKGNM